PVLVVAPARRGATDRPRAPADHRRAAAVRPGAADPALRRAPGWRARGHRPAHARPLTPPAPGRDSARQILYAKMNAKMSLLLPGRHAGGQHGAHSARADEHRDLP